jgi:diacylglycerol kinase
MEKKISLFGSFLCAVKGVWKTILSERNFRIQLGVAIIAVTVSIFFRVETVELVIIIILCFLVLIIETINTSLEKALNALSPEYNSETGLSKDTMAGAVLLCSILAVIVGVIILLPYLLNLIRTLQ